MMPLSTTAENYYTQCTLLSLQSLFPALSNGAASV